MPSLLVRHSRQIPRWISKNRLNLTFRSFFGWYEHCRMENDGATWLAPGDSSVNVVRTIFGIEVMEDAELPTRCDRWRGFRRTRRRRAISARADSGNTNRSTQLSHLSTASVSGSDLSAEC